MTKAKAASNTVATSTTTTTTDTTTIDTPDAASTGADSRKALLQSLRQDRTLHNGLRCFIRDLQTFSSSESAQLRLLSSDGGEERPFYLSSTYFSDAQAQFILRFPMDEATSLENALQATVENKMAKAKTGESSSYELCTSHDLAPVFIKCFEMQPDFFAAKEFKDVYKKFEKSTNKKK